MIKKKLANREFVLAEEKKNHRSTVRECHNHHISVPVANVTYAELVDPGARTKRRTEFAKVLEELQTRMKITVKEARVWVQYRAVVLGPEEEKEHDAGLEEGEEMEDDLPPGLGPSNSMPRMWEKWLALRAIADEDSISETTLMKIFMVTGNIVLSTAAAR
jgi:hypothetical protein